MDSLKNLSKPYREQIGCFPDFDDAFQLLPAIIEKNAVSSNAVAEILKCHKLIELNLSIEERKTDESFENDEAWELVRQSAKNALNWMQ